MRLIGQSLIGELFGLEHPECAEIIDFDSALCLVRETDQPINMVIEWDSPINMIVEWDSEYK